MVKLLVLVIGIIALVAVIFLGLNKGYSPSINQNKQTGHEDQPSNQKLAQWPALWGAPDNQSKCQKKDVKFSAPPIALEEISFFEPIGELRQGHIVPGDHGGINYKTSPTSAPVKVYAPADGFLAGIEKHPYTPPPGYPRDIQHYHIYLEHSCSLFTGFVHLTEFSPEILAASPELKSLSEGKSGQFKNIAVRIPLRAGQQIGTAWSFGLLGWVTVDLTHTNKGYLNPQSYQGENWRIHSVAFYDYFEDSLKEKIKTKNPRTKEPLGGKIDFDIEGKLVGNWFEKGTNGLEGDSKLKTKLCGNFPCPYWDGHLAFVYDYVDPGQLRVSVGHNWGLADSTPFGVKGNSPDFKDIGEANGLVKYELVALKNLTRQRGYDSETALITENDESRVLGTLLVQVVEDGPPAGGLKIEIFPGKSASSVSAFTPNAKMYER